jgi:hypothetical protein
MADGKTKRVGETAPISPEETKVLEFLNTQLKGRIDKTTALTVLRFVRGFNTDPDPLNKTLAMLDAFLKWREEKKIDELVASTHPQEEKFRAMWQCGMHGVGKQGHPILVDRPGQVDPTQVLEAFNVNDILNFHIQVMERLCSFKERISVERGQRCYKHIVILDLKGMGTKHIGKKFTEPMKTVIGVDQNFYPETLFLMFIVNASWLFKTLWAVISPWIDPLTKERIIWDESKMLTHIDADQIPQFLGGKCKCAGGKCLIAPFADGRPAPAPAPERKETSQTSCDSVPSSAPTA